MSTVNYLITELRILKSAAGHYIGRLYWDKEMHAWAPYDRVSMGYFANFESAKRELHLSIMTDCYDEIEMEAYTAYHRTGSIKDMLRAESKARLQYFSELHDAKTEDAREETYGINSQADYDAIPF